MARATRPAEFGGPRRAATALAVVALLAGGLQLAGAVSPKELQEWYASSSGLALSDSEAAALAESTWRTLTQCGVTVPKLSALKTALTDSGGMGLPLERVRAEVLHLAEQHASPKKIRDFFDALSRSYTVYGGLSLPKADAQERTLQLVRARAEPDQLYALYKVMYGYQGLGFDQKTAQAMALQQAFAGADADAFKSTYTRTKNLDEAVSVSIHANLDGVVRRHAKDGKPYTAFQFEDHYGRPLWLSEWLEAPLELRVSSDRLAHTASQFARKFGSTWESRYRAAAIATQSRLANDGSAYTMAGFQELYGDAWQVRWAAAPELPCAECAPFVAGGPTSLVV